MVVGCTTSSKPSVTETPVATTPGPSPAQAAAARVVFHAYNVMLGFGREPGSDRMQIFPDGNAKVVTLRGSDGPVLVCPIERGAASPPRTSCTAPGNGEPVAIRSTGVEVRTTSGRRTVEEVTVSYAPGTREVHVKSPTVIPKPGQSVCKDNGCNPFYEFTPRRAGTIRATATWDGAGTGRLLILVGPAAARGLSRTGRPYDVPAQQQASSSEGRPFLQVKTTVDGRTETAVALENDGRRALRDPVLEIVWPG